MSSGRGLFGGTARHLRRLCLRGEEIDQALHRSPLLRLALCFPPKSPKTFLNETIGLRHRHLTQRGSFDFFTFALRALCRCRFCTTLREKGRFNPALHERSEFSCFLFRLRLKSTVMSTAYVPRTPDEKTAKRGELVARARALGWSQNRLARRASIDPSLVSRTLTSKVSCPSVWVRLERVLVVAERARAKKAS